MSNLKKRYEKEYTSMWAAMEHVSENEHNKLVELCQRNCWIKRNGLAFRLHPLTEESSLFTFCRFRDIAMLKLFFTHGNWSIRQGVLYRDLFFCNQVDGGDEWWTCRYDHETEAYFPFESVSFEVMIEKGQFEAFLDDVMAASVEECKGLKYRGKHKERKGEKV